MAPKKGSKRAASPGSPSPRKRKLGPAEIIAQKCKVVSDELVASEILPAQVAEMLAGVVPESLGIVSDQRHTSQVQIVGMIRSTFADIEAALVETSRQKLAAIDTLAAEAAEGDAKKTAAETALDASEAAVADKKVDFDSAGVAVHHANVALSDAKDAQATGDQELAEAGERKGKLEAVLSGSYVALKDGGAEDVKVAVAEVLDAAKNFSMDSSMVTALPQVLRKKPGNRGSFETTVVLQSFEAEAQKCVSHLAALLEAGDASKAERAAAVEAATKSQGEATAALDASREALAAAKEEAKVKSAALKAAQSAAVALQAEADQASGVHSEAEAALSSFRAGPLATLQELEERSTPAPAPEAKEAEEAEAQAAETTEGVPAVAPADAMADDA